LALELFANQVQTTISSGGGTAPASGTSETWTAASSSGFPAASSSASPPTFFRGTDPALSSEKIIVTNVSGTTWTVTRGAEGTTPLAHAGGFTFQHVLTAGAVSGMLQLAGGTMTGPVSGLTVGGNAAGTGVQLLIEPSGDTSGTTDTAAVNAALTALPSGGGSVRFATGAFYVTCGSVSVNKSGVYFYGSGKWATYINAVGAGDVFRMQDTSTYSSRVVYGGGFIGMTIDGTAITGTSSGIHAGDILQLTFDVAVQNFTSGSSAGVHFDNASYWTEQARGIIYAQNCVSHVVFDVSGATTSTGSYMRSELEIYINQVTPSYDGCVFQNGAFITNGSLKLRGNFGGSGSTLTSAVLRLTGATPGGHAPVTNSNITDSYLDVGVELAAGTFNPQTIVFGTGCSITGIGLLNFGAAGAFTASNNSGNVTGVFEITGDSTLLTGLGFGTNVGFAGGLNIGDYGSATAVTANGQAITTVGVPGLILLSSTAARTGLILEGSFTAFDGQQIVVYNTTGFPLAFAAPGTSFVQAGVNDVIPAGQMVSYTWSYIQQLWCRSVPGAFTAVLGSSFTSGTGTAAQNVTGLAAYLGVGTWKVRGWFPYVGAGTVASTQTFAFTFSGTASGSAGYVAWKNNAAAYAAPTAGAAVTTSFLTPTITTTVYVMEFTGTVVVSAAGTLQLTVKSTVSGDEVLIEAGAFLEATQVT
jgi:hypothetical protein